MTKRHIGLVHIRTSSLVKLDVYICRQTPSCFKSAYQFFLTTQLMSELNETPLTLKIFQILLLFFYKKRIPVIISACKSLTHIH